MIYPSGGVVAGGAVTGGSYNSPNSGYVQAQPQTYPTQVVTGGAVPNQNVQQQPDVNTQYQDQNVQQNQQNQQNMGQQGNFQGNQQGGFVGSTTPQQGQHFTTSPQGQYQQPSTQYTNQQGMYSSTPGYQQGELLTEGSGTEENVFLGGQQQFTTSPNGQQGFNDDQQGYTDNTLTPSVENQHNDQFTQSPNTQETFPQTSPIPVIYPVPVAGQNTPAPSTQTNQFTQQSFETSPMTTQSPYPVIYPVPSAGQETPSPNQPTSTVSSNQDEFGTSSQFQNDAANFGTTQSPNYVPVPVPIPQNQNNGNVPLETTSTIPVQNDSGTMPVAGSYFGPSSTNSFQSTTPTTTNNFNNGQPSTGVRLN